MPAAGGAGVCMSASGRTHKYPNVQMLLSLSDCLQVEKEAERRQHGPTEAGRLRL